jgi:DTW domain-containing protein YfiP
MDVPFMARQAPQSSQAMLPANQEMLGIVQEEDWKTTKRMYPLAPALRMVPVLNATFEP